MNLKPTTWMPEGEARAIVESVMAAGEYQLRSRQAFATARKEIDAFTDSMTPDEWDRFDTLRKIGKKPHEAAIIILGARK